MSAAVTERMIDICCASHEKFGQRVARHVADERRAMGASVSPYRCPFGDGNHWHVAHPPTMERVEEIAFAIRDLHGNAPALVPA